MHVRWPALATSQSQEMASDWEILTLAGLCVAAIVVALILFSIVRWRRRNDELPPQFNRNDPLELAYTLIPVALVTVLFILTYRVEADVERVAQRPAATVEVTGFRWSWRFVYPGSGVTIAGTPQAPPELVLPAGATTRVIVTSDDVDHSFWIPDFLFKRDAIPGMNNVFDLHPTRIGSYRGVCGEYCGLAHAGMTFNVRVVSLGDYRRWLAAGGRVRP